MGRPKNQRARRRQIADAARRIMLTHGSDGLRIRQIAGEAGLSAGSILYYFPDMDDLVIAVYEHAVERFSTRRREAAVGITDPSERLAAFIERGLATGPDDEEVYLLHVAIGAFDRNPAIKILDRVLFDRQVAVYEAVLEAGEASGAFTLAGTSQEVARTLVALEDSLNSHIVTGNPAITRDVALGLVTGYARLATGVSLRSVT
ncbi:TetR/AcrR family transcriptional regulator [Actinomadura chibensis]|uniref:TetR family transcriptional regulator n=1 Tax=Actinomadura chibensis TaxID=392828 RepID=A0A5D0NBW4_9ACTN|nr:TetR family transcriptional regulator [Actinomadura chibensis]TYB41826.1 TetR family transcriptional regulator [Actinomadura chibensis]